MVGWIYIYIYIVAVLEITKHVYLDNINKKNLSERENSFICLKNQVLQCSNNDNKINSAFHIENKHKDISIKVMLFLTLFSVLFYFTSEYV